MNPGISKDDDPTIEDLQRSKSDLLSEHGLENTAIGEAAEKLEQEEQVEESQREALVRKKVLLATAEQRLGANDPDVEALRADVHDLESELEAEALRAQHEDNLEEARQKIDNLEGLAQRADSQNQDRLAKNYRDRAAALKQEVGLEGDDGGRYDTGPTEAEALAKNEAAEALQEFKDRKAQREIDERMSPEDRKMLSNYKTMRDQTSSEKVREKYEKKIEDLRNQYA